jgi:hypothetical protein
MTAEAKETNQRKGSLPFVFLKMRFHTACKNAADITKNSA